VKLIIINTSTFSDNHDHQQEEREQQQRQSFVSETVGSSPGSACLSSSNPLNKQKNEPQGTA
jgi:hypothetical protein